ncbi:MAG: TonB-dependent receptor [Crocinitomicaceae bacterium]
MIKLKITIVFLIISFLGYNQNIIGKVINNTTKEPVPFTVIKWKENIERTDAKGAFSISAKNFPLSITFEQVAFKSQTLLLKSSNKNLLVNLAPDDTLSAIEVEGKSTGKSIDLMGARHTETIGQGELRKAACCNLSESFETNASVDVSLSDAVSGAKKIQMLGLDGIYAQIQWENIPLVRGLSSSYGLGFIPGTWIESIQITKGTGPVVNGYESVAGLINLQIKEPSNNEKLYINTYANRFGRAELNIHGGQSFGKWKTMSFLNLANTFVEIDENKDGFKDLPTGFSGAFLNRWERRGKNMESKFGIRGIYIDKLGGQLGYDPSNNDQLKYGIDLNTTDVEVFAKNGFFPKKRKQSSIGTIVEGKIHSTENNFGPNTYLGKQKKLYMNAIYSDIISNTNHTYKTGASFILDDYNQTFRDSSFVKTEIVPGVFFEYTYHYLEKLTVVAGVRDDYHNLFGNIFSPRLHAKWNISPQNALRISAGKGTRVSNPYADYTSLMASNRQWMVSPDLLPEEALNGGLTFTQKFITNDNVSVLTLDYFYTSFLNQVVTDMDINSSELHIYNADGTSFSHSLQAELSIRPIKKLELRAAYKYYDVKAEFAGELQQRAFVPKQRVLLNLGYGTKNKKWDFDITGNWVGVKRLPSTVNNPSPYRRALQSENYWLVNSQISYNRPKISFYLGGENLLNYTQQRAIIGSDDPFGSYFDASQIWAPITGINIYAGLHYTIKHKKQ